jgi:hypothetical protein
MNVLFLDDNPVRNKMFRDEVPSAQVVETAQDCIAILQSLVGGDEWDYLFLDHDLGGEVHVESGREDCGMEVVRWMMENKPAVKKVIVHSHNVPAANRMVDLLQGVGYQCCHVRFQYKMGKLVV